MLFHNRRNAGTLLANKISQILLDKKNTIVIALPRGGVPVAFEVAKKLQVPLDVILVKKIGAPSFPELSVGAVSENNEVFYNEDLIERLGYEVSDMKPFKDHAVAELQKTKLSLRREFPLLSLEGKDIILVDDGITIIKYFLDISKKEQAERLLDRKNNPLKQWKSSPIDEVAQKKWALYSKYRNSMLLKTNHISAPWKIIHANNKKLAHLNVIRDLLSQINYPNKNKKILKLDPDIICTWKPGASELPALEK